jgi:predicted transcriptional regulator
MPLAPFYLKVRTMADTDDLVRLTAEIVSAHVSANTIAMSEVLELIGSVYEAFAGLGRPADAGAEGASPVAAEGAVSPRKSLADPEKIISMIDGKPYSTLKRHIKRHGYTPESYRERFGLKADYPMVAPAYSEARKTMAKALSVSGKVAGVAVAGAAAVALADALLSPPSANVRPERKAQGDEGSENAAAAPMALVDTARAVLPAAGVDEGARSVADAAAGTEPKRRGRPPKPKGDPVAVQPPGERSILKVRHPADDEFFDPAKA